MNQPITRLSFWLNSLVVITICLMGFGLTMIFLPDRTAHGFGVLLYGHAERIASFGPEAAAYIALVHAVLGAVMLGWGCILLFIVLGPLRRGSREALMMVTLSVGLWFVFDTLFSLWSGFRQNALLNFVFFTFIGIPLLGIYRSFSYNTKTTEQHETNRMHLK